MRSLCASRTDQSNISENQKAMIVSSGVKGTPFVYSPALVEIFELESQIYPMTSVGEMQLTSTEYFPEIHDELLKKYSGHALTREHESGIAIITSQSCNLACGYCLAKQGTFGLAVEHMKLDDVKKNIAGIFENDHNISFIKFFGGEPTLRMDLIEGICDFVTNELNKKVLFALTTNGTVKKAKDHLAIYRKYRINISVSIDGPKKIHDAQRRTKQGSGSFDKAYQYCMDLKGFDFPFAVVGVFDERHISQGMSYADTIKYLNTISPLVKVQFLEELGNGIDHDEFDIEDVRKQIYETVDEVFYRIRQPDFSPGRKHWFYDNNLFRFIYGIVHKKAKPYHHICTAARLKTIFPSGDIYPCYTMSEDKSKILKSSDDDYLNLEDNQNSLNRKYNWDSFETKGYRVPWYRGIVGDVCVADMENHGTKELSSSSLYKEFQENASLRILQHIVEMKSFAERERLLHATLEHAKLTGIYNHV